MINFHEGWYLIYTKPRHEMKVALGLAEKSINSFLPVRKTLRMWHDRKKYVEEPLFPSYIFIYLSDMQDYYTGTEIGGSLYYVRTGDRLARISDTIINNIQLVTCQAGEMEVSEERFHQGQRMVICQGALTGLQCEVVEYRNKQKLLVRVDLLKRNILLSLPAEHLIAV